MIRSDWMDAASACVALGVRRATLYAYVSRHRIGTVADPADPRRSLYARTDVERLAAAHRRPRARAEVAAGAIRWGDPVLETRISGVCDGRLWFGNRLASDCAAEMTLEEIACHHWQAGTAEDFTSAGAAPPQGATPMARVMTLLASEAAGALPMQDLSPGGIATAAAGLVSRVVDAAVGVAGSGPAHLRLARHWRCGPEASEHIRQALVLLSDHELNPSTFAVRICASTGASLPAALLAGACTLSGPLHGGVDRRARIALEAGPGAIRNHPDLLGRSAYEYGYGHPLYPAGDPRAEVLLEGIGATRPWVRRVRRIAAEVEAEPTVDAALAALARTHDLPDGTPMTLFLVSRTTGWAAHAMEQSGVAQPIRPRAAFRRRTEADGTCPSDRGKE